MVNCLSLKSDSYADLRAKTASSLITFSGIRPEMMGNYHGTDGLNVGDFPDLDFDNVEKSVAFTKVPAKLVIRRPISKSKKIYFTSIPEQACEYIREYLEARMRVGEDIKDDSAVITVSKFNVQGEIEHNNKKKYGQHVTTSRSPKSSGGPSGRRDSGGGRMSCAGISMCG